jgi:hypothetical protein
LISVGLWSMYIVNLCMYIFVVLTALTIQLKIAGLALCLLAWRALFNHKVHTGLPMYLHRAAMALILLEFFNRVTLSKPTFASSSSSSMDPQPAKQAGIG